jgi:hypothetical protein
VRWVAAKYPCKYASHFRNTNARNQSILLWDMRQIQPTQNSYLEEGFMMKIKMKIVDE